MFLERFKEVENFTITKLPLGGSKRIEIYEKSKIIFFGSGIGYRWEVGSFAEGLVIPYLSIFLSA